MAGSRRVGVVGLGAVGAFALDRLARRGVQAVGFDRFGRGHERGSHHGHTRVFRHAYFEHPDYVPLLLRATEGFASLEADLGVSLLNRCGTLLVGPAGSEMLGASAESAGRWGIPVERLGSAELSRRYPQFAVDRSTSALFEPGGGFVRPERAIRAALARAEQAGAAVHTDAAVTAWRATDAGARLSLEGGESVSLDAVIFAVGAYTPRLVPSLAPWLRVTLERQAWWLPDQPADASPGRLPAWLVDRGTAPALYGIPVDPDRPGPPLAKVALHGGGAGVDPESSERALSDADRAQIEGGARVVLPGLPGRLGPDKGCLYTTTPDEHFILDRVPGTDCAWVAAGLSGHGFKLAPALGEALADLAVGGSTDLPVGFLGCGRLR